MKKISYLGLVFLFVFLSSASFSQTGGNVKMKLNYNIGMPVGNFKGNYISNTSLRGGSGELGYWFNPRVAAGLNVGYQSYQQKFARQTYKVEGNQTISAVLTNTVETMPVMVTGTFAPLANTSKTLQPYLSAGAGVNLVSFRQYYGEFSDGESSASLAAQAGAGFMVPLGAKLNNAALQLGTTFNYSPYKRNGLTNLNTVGFNAGVVFPLK
jgi:hypothetical protein